MIFGPSLHCGLVLHLGLSLYFWSVPNFLAYPPSWSVPLSLVRPKCYGPSPILAWFYLWYVPNFMAYPPIMASPFNLVRPKCYGPSQILWSIHSSLRFEFRPRYSKDNYIERTTGTYITSTTFIARFGRSRCACEDQIHDPQRLASGF